MLIPDVSASDQYPGTRDLETTTWSCPLNTLLLLPLARLGRRDRVEVEVEVMDVGVEAVYLVEACQRVRTMGSQRLPAGG